MPSSAVLDTIQCFMLSVVKECLPELSKDKSTKHKNLCVVTS